MFEAFIALCLAFGYTPQVTEQVAYYDARTGQSHPIAPRTQVLLLDKQGNVFAEVVIKVNQ